MEYKKYNKYNKKGADSQTQQTNQWLPVGEGRRKAQYRVRGVRDTNY